MASEQFVQKMGDLVTVFHCVQETQGAILGSLSQTEGDSATVCSRVQGSWVVIPEHFVQIEGGLVTACVQRT